MINRPALRGWLVLLILCVLGAWGCKKSSQTPTCSANNCTGCCAGETTCVTLQGNTRCASNGAGSVCADCTATGGSCGTGGSCVGGAACSAANCSGCCAGNACVTVEASTACGSGPDAGAACIACGSLQTCTGGTCVGPLSANVGDPCAQDSDCSTLGTGALCKLTTPSGVPYVKGYCTLGCAGVCPQGSNCIDFSLAVPRLGVSAYGENTAFCLAACGSDTDCRAPDYGCWLGNVINATNNGFTQGAGCFPNPPADAGETGAPCTSHATCMLPPSNGFCESSVGLDGGPSGFAGGYCLSSCLGAFLTAPNPDVYCGVGGTCLVDNLDASGQPNSADCYGTCPTPGDSSACRASYICAPYRLNDGGQSPHGICYPGCQFTGCGSGTCQVNGYCM